MVINEVKSNVHGPGNKTREWNKILVATCHHGPTMRYLRLSAPPRSSPPCVLTTTTPPSKDSTASASATTASRSRLLVGCAQQQSLQRRRETARKQHTFPSVIHCFCCCTAAVPLLYRCCCTVTGPIRHSGPHQTLPVYAAIPALGPHRSAPRPHATLLTSSSTSTCGRA